MLNAFLKYGDRLCAFDHSRVPLPWFIWYRRTDATSRLRRRVMLIERGAGLERVGPGAMLLAAVLHGARGLREIVLCWRRRSPGCARGFGVSRGRQLATLLWTTFRYNFPPSLYYRARLFRLDRRRWPAVFSHDEAVALTPVMELRTAALGIWTKSGWHRFCRDHGLPGVGAVARVDGEAFVVQDAAVLARGADLFLKPDTGWGSRGAILLEWDAPAGGWRASGVKTGFVPRDGLTALAIEAARGGDLVVQERLRNHAGLDGLARRALINFRVMTIRAAAGRIEVFSAAMRMPGYDEHCSDVTEGYYVPLGVDDGELGFAETLDMGPGPQAVHPVTGAAIRGRVIAQWPEMRALAERAHALLPSTVPCVGWDFVATDAGVRILEANLSWSGNLAQQRGLMPLGESSWPAAMLAYVDEVAPEMLVAQAAAGRRLAHVVARAKL